MTRNTFLMSVVVAAIVGGTCGPLLAAEPEVKVVGPVVKIEMAADSKSAVAILRVKGQMVPIQIEDELTLNKFRIKKIQIGDEIRCIYSDGTGKHLSKTFRRTAGC